MKIKPRNAILKRVVISTLAAVCTLSSLATLCVGASNYKDTDGIYKVGGYAYRYTNTARYKSDYSSSYQKCISTNVTYQSWVFASKTSNPGTAVNKHVLLKNPKTGKVTPSYYFSTGTTRYMINYVNEYNDTKKKETDKYHYAGMQLWTASPKTGSAHIKWSPDSI